MKKGTYYKQESKWVGKERGVVESIGYIDTENQLAYEKNEFSGEWICTDMLIGYRIVDGKTKQECINNAKDFLPTLTDMRKNNSRDRQYIDYSGMCEICKYLIEKGEFISVRELEKKFGYC